jgi:DNA-directed RNA polymerase subunit F
MALVTIRETERDGDISFTTEYTFSSFEDFLKWEDYKQKVLKESLTSFEEMLKESLQKDGMSVKVVGLKETKH